MLLAKVGCVPQEMAECALLRVRKSSLKKTSFQACGVEKVPLLTVLPRGLLKQCHLFERSRERVVCRITVIWVKRGL